MSDELLFKLACIQITLVGERDAEGNLTIGGQSYPDGWPETLKVHGDTWRLSDTEGDREATGTTPENENEPETVRAFYDLDDPDAPDGKCPKCGEALDKCCGTGDPRCPMCDGPCPYHDDGPGPGEEAPTCPECEGELDEDGFCPEHGGPMT